MLLFHKPWVFKYGTKWKYQDNACVACSVHEEKIEHFLYVRAYENYSQERNWKEMYENNADRQFDIAQVAQKKN